MVDDTVLDSTIVVDLMINWLMTSELLFTDDNHGWPLDG